MNDVWRIVTRLASLFEPVGWHIQFLLTGHMRDALLLRLAELPVPVVVDHLGLFRPERVDGHKGFEALLRLLESDNAWLKVSGADRVTRDGRYEDAIPLMQQYIAVAPDRLVWGTDWPHPNKYDVNPNDGDLFDAFCQWVDDPGLRRQILVDNPARLYPFD